MSGRPTQFASETGVGTTGLFLGLTRGLTPGFNPKTNFLTIFLFEDLSGRRTSRYRRRPGFSSPSLPLLVFWPHAGAWGAGVILPPCAQLLWCELYVMKDTKTKQNKQQKQKNEPEEMGNSSAAAAASPSMPSSSRVAPTSFSAASMGRPPRVAIERDTMCIPASSASWA